MTQHTLNRRRLLEWVGASVSFATLAACGSGRAEAKNFPVKLSEAQWRKKLTKQEFAVLREAGDPRLLEQESVTALAPLRVEAEGGGEPDQGAAMTGGASEPAGGHPLTLTQIGPRSRPEAIP